MPLLLSADFFFKINFFQEHYQSHVKWSEPMFCLSWSGPKLFAKIIVTTSKEKS